MFNVGARVVLIVGLWLAPRVCQAADPATHTQELVRPAAARQYKPQAVRTKAARIMPSLRKAEDAPVARPAGSTSVQVVNLEFADAATCQAFELPSVKVITRFKTFADIFVWVQPDGHLDATVIAALEKLKSDNKLTWYEPYGEKSVPPLPRVKPIAERSRAFPDQIVRGGYNGLTGKGVIIAIIDSGIDFRHPDFITYDAAGLPTSRVLYFWDTLSESYANGFGAPAPLCWPNGAPIGTIFSRDNLTAELRSARPHILEFDTYGHGTGCAGVAAGNGNASKGAFAGVAPGADIIAVRIGGHAGAGAMENGFLYNAICGWLDEKAGQQPLVVSCSFGGQYGGRDGYLIEERQTSARFDSSTRARAICICSGNEAELPIHAGLDIKGANAQAVLSWSSSDAATIELYLQTDDDADIHVNTPPGASYKVLQDYVHPLTQNVYVKLDVGSGKGELSVYSKSGRNFGADAYIYGGDDARFDDQCLSANKLVGAPGAASQAITVGSYDFNDHFNTEGRDVTLPDTARQPITIGQLSSYSSPGPRRLGDGPKFAENVVKPDIVSPGEWHVVATPLNVVPIFSRDSTGYYADFNGTSAATPYTAGVIALLFEKQPSLTVGEVKDLLHACAQKDAYAQDVPGPGWGYGKLNIQAVAQLLSDSGGK
ncbi:MAG TPA: S8 family serine peptidase [Pirellulales bacterium]|jgi:subtilisin family serine protease|nr:S8 family serine peptidase [Pirellulales bacterium]